jgi:hypothetical protein
MHPSRGRRRSALRSLDGLLIGMHGLPTRPADARRAPAGVRRRVGAGPRRRPPAVARPRLRAAVAGDNVYLEWLEALAAVLMRVNVGLEERRRALERQRAAQRWRGGAGAAAAGAAGAG